MLKLQNILEYIRPKYTDTSTVDYVIMGDLMIQWDSNTITPTAAKTPTSKTITFPRAFATTPRVFISLYSTAPGTVNLGCSATNVTKTTFDAYITRANTNTSTFVWFAIGKA